MLRGRWTRSLFAAATATAVLLAGCGGDGDDGGGGGGGGTGPVPVAAVTVTAPQGTIDVGATVQLTAKVTDAAGNTLNYTVTWKGDEYASVSTTGLVTGLKPGNATITATSGGRTGTIRVTVIEPVAVVELSMTTASVAIGKTVTITATAKDADGEVVTRTFTWTTSNPAIATVADGVITGVAAGTATITATTGTKSATVTITVTPPVATVALEPTAATLHIGETMPFTATAKDAAGTVLLGRVVDWTTDNGAVATVSDAGVVTAVGAGTATLTADVEGKTATAALTVLAPVASVTVAPTTASLLTAETVQLTATLLDGSGDPVDRPVTWTSSAPAVATVGDDGLVTALVPGTATITATSEGVNGTAAIEVRARVAAVAVAPTAATIVAGETTQLAATVYDADGNPLDRPIEWTSAQASVATVSATGLVTGVAAGEATITATSGEKIGSAVITVLTRVASVEILLAADSMELPDTLRLIARLRDTDNEVVNRPVHWSTSDPGIARVDEDGLVTSVAAGTVTITAESGGKSASKTLTVMVPVANVVIAPNGGEFLKGESLQLGATATDAGGNVLNRSIAWTSGSLAVATVDGNGLVTGVGAGTTTITATAGGIAATVGVTVLEPVARVDVTAPATSLLPTETVQLTATPRDAAGNPLVRLVEWSSSNSLIASVDDAGLVTALVPGTATITAEANGVEGAIAVTVLVPVSTVEVTAPADSVIVRQTLQLTAVARDAIGNVLDRDISWSTSDGSAATVDEAGLVTGAGKGSATITASVEGATDDVMLSVKAAVATMTVTWPSHPVTEEGTTLSAMLLDEDGIALLRQVTWTTSNPAVLTVTPLAPTTAQLNYVGSGTATITASVEGITEEATLEAKGPPSGGEEGGNNLSTPVIFANGLDIAGALVGTSAGLRPLATEGITVDTLPFWWEGNVPDYLGSYFLQGGANTWRPEWLDGSSTAMHSASVDWGDNLMGTKKWNTSTPVRVEVALFARGVPTMKGFTMMSHGSGTTEVFYTDGQVLEAVPMIFTSSARLRIERLDAQGGTPVATLFEGSLADGGLTAEINGGGKIIYGYQMQATVAGWYRLSFVLDDATTVGGNAVTRNVSLDEAPAGEAVTPTLTGEGRVCYIEIEIVAGTGGGGGGGR